MASKLALDIYTAKPIKFGNGARLVAFKKHINKDMIIMTKKKYEELTSTSKFKDLSNKEEKEISKKTIKLWDQHTDKY